MPINLPILIQIQNFVLIHWGSVDAPEASAFNGNPQDILDNVVNPERVVILAPGEEYVVD